MKKISFILALTSLLAVSVFVGKIYYQQNIIFTDYPYHLSDSVQIIEVFYTAWACDCANWREINKDDDYFFLEAANDSMKLQEEYWSKIVRLKGRFYEDTGVSRDFVMNTDKKPEKARVFRWEKVEEK